MNYYALAVGFIIATYVVIRFRKTKIEKKKWVYPALLATFPVYYWIFAVYTSDYSALINEFIIGLVFFVVAYVAYKINSFMSLLLLAIAYIAHAGYDVAHNFFFYNSGVPIWWPEFCGSVDLLIGLYLVYSAVSVMKRNREITSR